MNNVKLEREVNNTSEEEKNIKEELKMSDIKSKSNKIENGDILKGRTMEQYIIDAETEIKENAIKRAEETENPALVELNEDTAYANYLRRKEPNHCEELLNNAKKIKKDYVKTYTRYTRENLNEAINGKNEDLKSLLLLPLWNLHLENIGIFLKNANEYFNSSWDEKDFASTEISYWYRYNHEWWFDRLDDIRRYFGYSITIPIENKIYYGKEEKDNITLSFEYDSEYNFYCDEDDPIFSIPPECPCHLDIMSFTRLCYIDLPYIIAECSKGIENLLECDFDEQKKAIEKVKKDLCKDKNTVLALEKYVSDREKLLESILNDNVEMFNKYIKNAQSINIVLSDMICKAFGKECEEKVCFEILEKYSDDELFESDRFTSIKQ